MVFLAVQPRMTHLDHFRVLLQRINNFFFHLGKKVTKNRHSVNSSVFIRTVLNSQLRLPRKILFSLAITQSKNIFFHKRKENIFFETKLKRRQNIFFS